MGFFDKLRGAFSGPRSGTTSVQLVRRVRARAVGPEILLTMHGSTGPICTVVMNSAVVGEMADQISSAAEDIKADAMRMVLPMVQTGLDRRRGSGSAAPHPRAGQPKRRPAGTGPASRREPYDDGPLVDPFNGLQQTVHDPVYGAGGHGMWPDSGSVSPRCDPADSPPASSDYGSGSSSSDSGSSCGGSSDSGSSSSDSGGSSGSCD